MSFIRVQAIDRSMNRDKIWILKKQAVHSIKQYTNRRINISCLIDSLTQKQS